MASLAPVFWIDDPRVPLMAEELRRSMVGLAPDEIGAAAARVLRRWVEAEPAALAAVPVVVFGCQAGSTAERAAGASQSLASLTGTQPSSQAEVAACVDDLRSGVARSGHNVADIARMVETTDPVLRRYLATALGIGLAASARAVADIPVLAVLAIGDAAVTQRVGELLAEASSVGIQAFLEPEADGP